LEALVKTCTRVTHTDPQAEHGAMVAALAAGMSSRGRVDGRAFLSDLRRFLSPSAPVFPLIERAVEAAEQGWPVKDFVRELGLEMGVTGFINHTMPVVVHAWLRHPGDFRTAVRNVIARGGDTDTTAAILGGIIGAGAGRAGLPEDLLKGLWSWPLTQEYIRRLAEETAEAVEHNRPARPPRPLLAAHLARNLFALAVVVGHGFRRLGPPY
jgi:ADP-ribosylglycohydrolase